MTISFRGVTPQVLTKFHPGDYVIVVEDTSLVKTETPGVNVRFRIRNEDGTLGRRCSDTWWLTDDSMPYVMAKAGQVTGKDMSTQEFADAASFAKWVAKNARPTWATLRIQRDQAGQPTDFVEVGFYLDTPVAA